MKIYSDSQRYYFLYKHIKYRQPKIFVEIGVNSGNNAKIILDRFDCIEKYIGFDICEKYSYDEIISYIDNKKFELIKGDTTKTLKKFINNNPNFEADFIYIDGGHSPRVTQSDWKYSQKLSNKDTLFLFDDLYMVDNTIHPDWGSGCVIKSLNQKIFDYEISEEHDVFKKIRHLKKGKTYKEDAVAIDRQLKVTYVK